MQSQPKQNLLDLDRPALADWFVARGEKPFRAQQVLKWIHQQGVDDFDDMTNLSKSLRESLKAEACIEGPLVAADQCACRRYTQMVVRTGRRESY